MIDIKRLSSAIVQFHIHINEETTPKRDPQRRLNPIMQEAVHAEIVKLLDNRIIYPISDSQWVKPVHAVPKKSGFTVVENENKELCKLDFPRRSEFALTIGSLMLQLVRTIFHFPSLIKCLKFGGSRVLLFLGRLLRL